MSAHGVVVREGQAIAGTRLNAGSLLRLHLVRHLLADPCVRLASRAVDARWRYAELIRNDYQGFAPHSGSVFFARHSQFERWLARPAASARPLNARDRLVHEVMFAVHDYLHVWAYEWIKVLRPALGLGERRITRRNAEGLVFAHLISEAVATVGLDYWYLCTFDLNQRVDVGSSFRALTVSYDSRLDAEYQRFAPSLQVQSPGFFPRLATFYSTGLFEGFSAEDLKRSPRLYDWLSHELGYGVAQREYSRMWISYLSAGRVSYTPAELKEPVVADLPWQRRLLDQLAKRLWNKVKNEQLESPPRHAPATSLWASPLDSAPDFRFVNFNVAGKERLLVRPGLSLTANSLAYLIRQNCARLDFARAEKKLAKLSGALLDEGDHRLAMKVLGSEPTIKMLHREPRDIFFLS